jgi:cytochrome c-type biogenesis protein
MSMLPLPIAAFAAGLVSFLTPCVLPLIPGYISLISGVGLDELRQSGGRVFRSVMSSSIFFILGFSAVFLALGVVVSGLGQVVRQHIATLTELAGSVILFLGQHQVGLLPIPALYADKRFHDLPSGAAGTKAFLIGAAFGFGWTPCVGPILAVILAFVAGESTLAKGTSLLATYSLRLAIPFLVTAMSVERFLVFYCHFRRHLHMLELINGAVMIALGLLFFTHHFVILVSWMNHVPFFSQGGREVL